MNGCRQPWELQISTTCEFDSRVSKHFLYLTSIDDQNNLNNTVNRLVLMLYIKIIDIKTFMAFQHIQNFVNKFYLLNNLYHMVLL